MRFRTYLLALIAAALVAGCGGGNDTQADVEALASCMESALPSYEVSTDQDSLDLISAGAGVGGVQIRTDQQEIQLSAERTADDADDTATQYESFGGGDVQTTGTVVAAYNNEPTDEESGAVEGCLSDQGIG